MTTPTVRIPLSRAAFAITGAAPVPVPPPIPAVIKTILQSASSAMMSSRLSSAASLPISGFEPAPSPPVSCDPSWTLRSAFEWARDCPSVLATRKSTPSSEASIMLFTALQPPPPTPTTVILGRSSWVVCCGMLRLMLIISSFINGVWRFRPMGLKRADGAAFGYSGAPIVSDGKGVNVDDEGSCSVSFLHRHRWV